MLLGIPGHAEGLQPTFADLDQVLLQRCDAEGVGDLEVGILAVNAGGVDPEFVALARETGGFVFRFEGDVIEVAQHRLGIGLLHRQLVMRALPVLDLLAVAALALLLIDHRCRRHGDRLRFDRLSDRRADRRISHGGRFAAEQKPADARDGQQQDAEGDGKQVTVNQGRWRIRVWLYRFIFMFRHCDFHSPGAFAVRRAFKLDAALPDGRRLSNDGCDPLHYSPTNQRKYGFPPSPRITSRISLAHASRSPSYACRLAR